MLNTSAITVVTKSSMKPQSSTTANRHLCGNRGRNEKQCKLLENHDASIGAAVVGQKAHLRMKQR